MTKPFCLKQLKQNTEVGCGPEVGGLFGGEGMPGHTSPAAGGPLSRAPGLHSGVSYIPRVKNKVAQSLSS